MNSFAELFTNNIPLIDVRAQVEFTKGAFPSAVNLPVLNDEEREAVGICYKNKGPEAAEKLGHELVSGDLRVERIGKWVDFIRANPDAQLYCFRGGKRSQIVCQWLAENGIQIPRIEGGYKAMRQYLLECLNKLPSRIPLVVLAGKTGSGKTEFLHEKFLHDQSMCGEGLQGISVLLDLEGLANHRGSAFGGRSDDQPTQINFENAVAILLVQHYSSVAKSHPLMLEDESRTIGKVHLPEIFFAAMQSAPVFLLEDSLDSRVERIYEEYVVSQYAELVQQFECEDRANNRLKESMLNSLRAISRRLGGVETANIHSLMENAFASMPGEAHKKWIHALLDNYYDPMYNYQIQKKMDRVICKGSKDELMEGLMDESFPALNFLH